MLPYLIIIFVHWFADFVLQTDAQAKGKSKAWGPLLSHVNTYTLVWAIIFLFVVGSHVTDKRVLFIPITWMCHLVTDYFTSRLSSKLWAKGDVHNFFVCIGFDQVLHYAQLFITYQLLFT